MGQFLCDIVFVGFLLYFFNTQRAKHGSLGVICSLKLGKLNIPQNFLVINTSKVNTDLWAIIPD